MKEEKLTPADRKHLFVDIKNSYLVGFGFLTIVLFFMTVAHTGFALFGINNYTNWLNRIIITFGFCLFICCMVALSYYNYYLDLISGKKVTLTVNRYKIVCKRNIYYLVTDIPNYNRIELDDEHIPHINRTQPLNIQLAKRSQSILFISNSAPSYLYQTAALSLAA
ncbi:MAG TPA: hypothetical protein VK835_04495 [Bacteroidia bacterium]|nr:hypothetical protein [Bacteroidia bacterium]